MALTEIPTERRSSRSAMGTTYTRVYRCMGPEVSSILTGTLAEGATMEGATGALAPTLVSVSVDEHDPKNAGFATIRATFFGFGAYA